MGATVPAVLKRRDLRRDALVGMNILLEAFFIVSPELPVIATHPKSEYVHLDEVYRQFCYFIHEWAMSTRGYHFEHSEIRTQLLKAAEKHGKTAKSR